MWRKMVRGLLCLEMAFTLLTGCGINNGNMDKTADMALRDGGSRPGTQAVQEPAEKNIQGTFQNMLYVLI